MVLKRIGNNKGHVVGLGNDLRRSLEDLKSPSLTVLSLSFLMVTGTKWHEKFEKLKNEKRLFAWPNINRKRTCRNETQVLWRQNNNHQTPHSIVLALDWIERPINGEISRFWCTHVLMRNIPMRYKLHGKTAAEEF